MDDLIGQSITTLARHLRSGEIRPVEVVEAYLRRVEEVEPKVQAFLSLDSEKVLRQAQALEEKGGPTEDQPLWGVPIGIKDILAEKDAPLTCGSRILEGFRSPYEATAVERLRKAGAILFGRLNMDEFAMGSSTENSAYHVTRNPWDLDRTPGGSSGGCAAAVAAGECPGAVGSDTGGSVRQPAAFCGLVGLKPTYGRISRYGLVAFASSLDQVGPVTRSVEDAALLLQVMAGHDPKDSTSLPAPVPNYMEEIQKETKEIRLGIPKGFIGQGMDPEVRRVFESATDRLSQAGAQMEEIDLPHLDYALAAYYIIAPAEASANLARYDGVRYGLRVPGVDPNEMYKKSRGRGFGREVKRRIILGTYALSSGYYDAYYLQALRVRRVIREDFDRAFQQVDLILVPTAPTPAFRLGEKVQDPVQLYLSDIYTVPCNLAGLCGISLPAGVTKEGLPVGIQLLGAPLEEVRLLRVARWAEEVLGWPREGWWAPENVPNLSSISIK